MLQDATQSPTLHENIILYNTLKISNVRLPKTQLENEIAQLVAFIATIWLAASLCAIRVAPSWLKHPILYSVSWPCPS